MGEKTIGERISEALQVLFELAVFVFVIIFIQSCGNNEDQSQEQSADQILRDQAYDYVKERYSFDDLYPDFDIRGYIDDCGLSIEDLYDDDEIAENISDYYSVSDVFSDDEIIKYIGDNYYYELNWIFTDKQIQEYAHDFYLPEDIYTDEELLEWYEEYQKRNK